jgi:hypothetical protein
MAASTGAIWGASYLFIRVASPVLRPFPLVFVRLALGGVLLAAATIHANEVIGFGAIVIGLTPVTGMLARRSAAAEQPHTPPPAYSSSPSTRS